MSGRRRTPGLRREEVAELAGISAGLYTWLEQGRDVPISRRTADAIATALQLDRAERTHLHFLTSREHTELDENPSPALHRLVFSMSSHPAFVLDHTWDVLLINDAGRAVFGDSEELSTPLNLLEETYLKPRFRKLFPDWECVVSHLSELFRYDYAAYASDVKVNELVARLQAASPVFKANWEQHRIRPFPGSVREIDHPRAGHLSLEPTTYSVVESPGLRLLMYTPTDATTRDRIAALVAEDEREGRLSEGKHLRDG